MEEKRIYEMDMVKQEDKKAAKKTDRKSVV